MNRPNRARGSDVAQDQPGSRSGFAASRDPNTGISRRVDPELVVRTCPNCSAGLLESRCKLLCPRCHYYMSCSDYY